MENSSFIFQTENVFRDFNFEFEAVSIQFKTDFVCCNNTHNNDGRYRGRRGFGKDY